MTGRLAKIAVATAEHVHHVRVEFDVAVKVLSRGRSSHEDRRHQINAFMNLKRAGMSAEQRV